MIEICKDSDPFGSLSGPFYYFTIDGQPQLGEIPVFVDSCTENIALPDGYVVISEVPDPSSVLESVWTEPYAYSLISVDLGTSSATVLAVGTDPSTWVTVHFVNTPLTIPEPGTGGLLGLALAGWAYRGSLRKRLSRGALRNATRFVVRRAVD